MLRERYAPMNLFDLVPTVSMALDPVLTQLDRLLDDDTLFQTVKADVACRFPRTPREGRPSTPVKVILRMLVVKHLYGWSAEATERWVSDRVVWRQCCRVDVASGPDETTLLRWATLLQPATLHHLRDHVVILARSLTVTRGRQLRIAGTVVATPIHHPTDRTWLDDGVRVLGRTWANARAICQPTPAVARDALRERTRRAKRQMKRIMEAARQRGTEAADRMRTAYQRRLAMMQATVPPAQPVGAIRNAQATPPGKHLAAALAHMVPLVCQVISQTTRRVLQGEVVPAAAKVVSLFEPQTAMIRTGKPGRPTAFGRVIWLDAVEGGIVSRYTVLDGNPAEDAQLPPSLEHHRRVFKRPPRLLTGDRGVHSAANEPSAMTHGVKQVVWPKPGAKSGTRIAYEPQRWCRRGRDWRAGIEGRISGLKRRHTLERCRDHGTAGMERWVGWGRLAHNLRVIAQATAA